MAPLYTLSEHHPAVSPLPQPLDGPCLFTGRGAPGTSDPAYCCHNIYLQHGLGHYMQWAGSLGAPTALTHQLPRAVDSASSLTAVPATAFGQAPARSAQTTVRLGGIGRYFKQCVLVYQPVGRYTITPHFTACPPSPPLDSHTVQITARCPHPRAAQSCGRRALTIAYVPRRVSLLAQTLCKLREDEEQILLVAPIAPPIPGFPNSFSSRQHLPGTFL